MQPSPSNDNQIKTPNVSTFTMPEIWDNIDAIYNLMQTFKRPRSIDPIEYDKKINFWSSLIQRYAKHNKILLVNESYLQSVFEKVIPLNGVVIRPLCLGRVLAHLKNESRLVDVTQFREKSLAIRLVAGLGWALTVPLRWSFNQVASLVLSQPSMPEETDIAIGDLVVVDLLEDTINDFVNMIVSQHQFHISPHIDVISTTNFNDMLSKYISHNMSRSFFLDLLIQNRLIEFVTLNSGTDKINVVKFARSVESPLSSTGIDKSHQEKLVGLVQLRVLVNKLEADAAMMQGKVDQLKDGVRRCLHNNRKEEAKNYLKRGKIIEKMLERKHVQIENVESMLVQIDAADDNLQVVRALGNAAAALKAHSLDIDTVQDTMAEVGDVLADQEEINASMGALGGEGQSDLGDLEMELSRLLVVEDEPGTGEMVSQAESACDQYPVRVPQKERPAFAL